jgi:hypothetical protein
MRPGDLVIQAPNVFIDITVADKKMLVLKVVPSGSFAGATVRTLLEGKERVWHRGELEVFNG